MRYISIHILYCLIGSCLKHLSIHWLADLLICWIGTWVRLVVATVVAAESCGGYRKKYLALRDEQIRHLSHLYKALHPDPEPSLWVFAVFVSFVLSKNALVN